MKTKSRHSGLTLIEMTVVIAAVASLSALSLPAVNTFFSSLASSGSAKTMISAAMSNARAIAAKHQRYAGIRFQKVYDLQDGPMKANQYMIFIVHEEPKKMDNLTTGFRAVDGLEPIKLPESIGVMDFTFIKEQITGNPSWEPSGDPELTDLTTFSIIFSPSGKMVIHNVRVRNRDGVFQPDNAGTKVSMDDIFNSPENIEQYKIGMFVQDDYAGLGQELSRNSFIIYERQAFRQAYEEGTPYSGYLYRLVTEPIYINPYTGTIISSD